MTSHQFVEKGHFENHMDMMVATGVRVIYLYRNLEGNAVQKGLSMEMQNCDSCLSCGLKSRGLKSRGLKSCGLKSCGLKELQFERVAV